jgi:ankyrin repeat protein
VYSDFMAWIQELIADPSLDDFMDRWNEYPRSAAPLYFAASFGLLVVVKSLVEASVDLNNHGGSCGGTALHAAAWRDHPEIVRLLLEAGADQMVEDLNEMTAYDLAECSGNDNIERLLDRSNSLLSTGNKNIEVRSNVSSLGNEKTQMDIY